jgi:hypothetical protein
MGIGNVERAINGRLVGTKATEDDGARYAPLDLGREYAGSSSVSCSRTLSQRLAQSGWSTKLETRWSSTVTVHRWV